MTSKESSIKVSIETASALGSGVLGRIGMIESEMIGSPGAVPQDGLLCACTFGTFDTFDRDEL